VTFSDPAATWGYHLERVRPRPMGLMAAGGQVRWHLRGCNVDVRSLSDPPTDGPRSPRHGASRGSPLPTEGGQPHLTGAPVGKIDMDARDHALDDSAVIAPS